MPINFVHRVHTGFDKKHNKGETIAKTRVRVLSSTSVEVPSDFSLSFDSAKNPTSGWVGSESVSDGREYFKRAAM